MELEAELTRGMLGQARGLNFQGSRSSRSVPEAEFLARGPVAKEEETMEDETVASHL